MPDISDAVRSQYGAVAASDLSSEHAGVRAVAEAFGYSPAELSSIPSDANMGLSCGNPTALASLKPGETVLDLGCGGGLDVFLAAQKVGPAGKAIGVDMTPEMIDRAKRNAGAGATPIENVEFLLGTIDQLPLPASSVDCVISNCVINLAPDKPAVFREMLRVLKPGGRIAVSDIALKKPLPKDIGDNLLAYVGCIAGAIQISDYQRGLTEAGFAGVTVVDSGIDLNAYSKVDGQAGCCAPAMTQSKSLPIASAGCCGGSAGSGAEANTTLHGGLKELLARYDINACAASVKIYAIKPPR